MNTIQNRSENSNGVESYRTVKKPIRQALNALQRSFDEAESGGGISAFNDPHIQADRRTASRSHAALSIIAAEHGLSDRSTRLLLALMGISEGQHSFKTTYEMVYRYLRKHDPTLKKADGQLDSKASQTVRRYVDALAKDQQRTGVVYAEIQSGDMGKDGTRYPTMVSLPMLDYLDEVNRRTKANPSYSRASRTIRETEARKLAGELLAKPGYQPQAKTESNPMAKIDRMLKQTAGMLDSAIREMEAFNYTDDTIQARLLKALSDRARAILSTDTIETETKEHGRRGPELDLTPMFVPGTVSGQAFDSDTLPSWEVADDPVITVLASVDDLHQATDPEATEATTEMASLRRRGFPEIAIESETDPVAMLEAFESVGANRFDLTTTSLEGVKQEFERGMPSDGLKATMPNFLRRCESARLNVIVRPQLCAVADRRLIQLDDLDQAAIDCVGPFAFLVIETSPDNFQAWIAVDQASDDEARRLKKGCGSDPTASGAARIAGSRNFKAKHAPGFPCIRVAQAAPGRVVTIAELDQAGLIAPKESASTAPRHAPSFPHHGQPVAWPSYQRCLADAPRAKNHDGPDRSSADFEFCLIALDRGWHVEAVAQRLMLDSAKAERAGLPYALHTAQRANAVIENRKAGFITVR